MQTRSWLRWLGVVAVGAVAGVCAFLALLQWAHWRQDEANLHALVQLINYNVQHGRLLVPEVAVAPTSPPASPPGTTPAPK